MDDRAWAGALQPDGKIIAAGFTNSASSGTDFGLVRWNADGSLDGGFGQGGKVITDMRNRSSVDSRIWGVSVQTDGKIVASGDAGAVALARYLPNGALDTSFGNKGKVFTSGASGRANVIQPDGKIIVIAYATDFAVYRYNANGSLDNSFGTKGKVVTDFGGNDEPRTVVLQSDGKIVVAGRRISGDQDIVVARYNSNGSLDTSFGSGGKVVTDLGPGADSAHALALQPDGKIVVAGRIDGESNEGKFALARYNADGSLDDAFDGDGIVTIAFSGPVPSFDEAYAVAVQNDGKIVVGGVGDNEYFSLARLNVDGSLDSTFGTGGKVATDLTPGGWHDFVSGLFIQPSDQKIVAVGSWDADTGYDYAAARYYPDGSLDAGEGLQAAGTPAGAPARVKPLDAQQVQPLLSEALARWQAAGVDTSALAAIDIRIADLGGATLGLASGSTIWLDDNAAGWGWFVDRTPRSDSEFTRKGNQGEMNRMDLLTVLAHEIGHLLGHEHDAEGVMGETLGAGVRRLLVDVDQTNEALLFEWFAAENRTRTR